jgi:xylulose-5-phosphate/fructose-6-phosphate phosphoketolase
VIDVIDRVPTLGARAARLRQDMLDMRVRARAYTRAYGDDPPEISGWIWPHALGETSAAARS